METGFSRYHVILKGLTQVIDWCWHQWLAQLKMMLAFILNMKGIIVIWGSVIINLHSYRSVADLMEVLLIVVVTFLVTSQSKLNHNHFTHDKNMTPSCCVYVFGWKFSIICY